MFEIAEMTINVMQGHWYWRHSKEHVRHSISHPLYLCLSCSVSELFDVKNIVTLKSTFRVTHPENLCKDCTSLKSTDRWLYLCR